MTGEPVTTIVGNLTADPELRFTQAGVAVANFTVASTPRTFNRQTQQWEDGEALFMRSSVWRDVAENVAESLRKGDRVIATGRLVQRSFQDRDGNQRTAVQMEIDEIGPSNRYHVTQSRKVQRGQQGGGFQGQQQGQGYAPQGQQGGFSGPGPQQSGYAPQGGQQGAWAGQQPQQGQQSPWAGQQQGAPQGQQPQQGGFSGPGFNGSDDPPF